MNVVIGMITILIVAAIITCVCVINNPCIGCNEPAAMCKSCKHYDPPSVVASNYEPKEGEMKEIDFLAKRINALDDEEFLQLSKLVVRGYENGRD